MKQILLLVACLTTWGAHAQTVNEKPFTVPELTSWQGGVGTAENNIRVVTKRDKSLPSEAYRLRIDDKRATIWASDERGLIWGRQTLMQLQEQGPLQKGEALDVPQYRMRGFMIDVGRKYIPISYLRSLVRVMSYYKMNTLQIHLNDNGFRQYFGGDWTKTYAAFRLQSDTYPGLAAKDGFYTKQEFIDLQLLADSLGVEIIPEIDAPAHVLAFTHYRPSLGSKEYGMDHFDLSNPEVYTFMDALFEEYLSGKTPVFRGPRVNIGTDEYSNAKKEVVEQFRAFTDHYLSLVKRYGKHPCLWGALTHAKGETPVQVDDVLMNCWYNGYAEPDSMMQLGYKTVSIPDGWVYIVPAAGYYYDYLNCQHLYDNWTPAKIGNKTFAEQHPQIEGGMFAVWNDHYGNGISVKDIHHRVFPALQTMATKCWTGQLTSRPYHEFNQKRLLLSEAPGVNELGRIKGDESELRLDVLQPQKPLHMAVSEAGYDYAIEMDIDCRSEQKGTILTTGPNATFYLSDPEQGKLGFARDGYLNTFNYRLPQQGKVTLRIEGTNQETRLFVNGKKQQTLGIEECYVIPFDRPVRHMPGAEFQTNVYQPSGKMKYVQTLFFPLQEAGDFKSQITNLRVFAL